MYGSASARILARCAAVESVRAMQVGRGRLDDPLIASDAARLGELYAQLTDAEEKVRRLYDRWAELEALRERLSQEEGGEG